MRRLILLAASLIPLTSCLIIERTRLEIDLKKMTGEVRFLSIGTDDAAQAQADFAELINNHIRGTQLETDNPGWNIASKELYVENGALNGVAKFSFLNLDAVKVYKHDKKSPYFYCVASGETLLSTNGVKIPSIPTCIALDRKQGTLIVEAKKGDFGNGRSLLTEYQAWDGGPVAGGSATPGLGGLGALTESLEGLGQAFGAHGAGAGGELSSPWKEMNLPIQSSEVVSSGPTYFMGTIQSGYQRGAWLEALQAKGWKMSNESVYQSADTFSASFTGGTGGTLAFAEIKEGTAVTVSISVLE